MIDPIFTFFLKIKSKIFSFYYDINTRSKFLSDNLQGNDLPSFKNKVKGKLFKWSQSNKVNISAVYRIYNAEDFLYLSVSSIVPFVDEIIFVDNASTDSTLKTIEKCILLCDQYRVQYKLAHYNKKVNSQGVNYKMALVQNPEGSLADYYNFSFDLASNAFVFKIDAHMIMHPESFKSIYNSLEKNKVAYIRGANIYGRKMTYEPRLYHKDLSKGYYDSEFFEKLDLNVSTLTKYKSRIYRKAYWHVGLYS